MISLTIEFLVSVSVAVFLLIKISQEKKKAGNRRDRKKILIFRVVSCGLLAISVISAIQVFILVSGLE